MALNGCCCCGLRGGAKSVGVLFLVITLLKLIGVVGLWVVYVHDPPHTQGFGVDTPGGRFGVQVSESRSMFGGGSSGGMQLNLGKLGSYGASFTSDGTVKLHSPGGDISNGSREDAIVSWINENMQMVLIIYTTYVMMAVVFNSMLIHGTNNDSTCAVLFWLIFYCVVFKVYSLTSLGCLIKGLLMFGSENRASHNAALVIAAVAGTSVLICALLWYWWVLVLSFYQHLREGTRGFKYHREVSLQEHPVPLVSDRAANAGWKVEGCP